jgi:hypothetical protein
MSHKVNRWKNVQLVPALGVFLLVGGAVRTRSCDDCQHRIHKAEENFRKAVHRYGEHSRQAEERRHQLEQAERSCRGNRDRH